ncbi:MAG: hypothetical protein KKI09_12280 [Spirochaetes bacterium]|nr:hypothetical protein [Spirochaetota bacterium]
MNNANTKLMKNDRFGLAAIVGSEFAVKKKKSSVEKGGKTTELFVER